jgi:hypothetical protein
MKEEKNIKRRIYDALNVMISAELLERDLSSIQIKNKNLLISRTYSIVDKKEDL